MNNHQSPCLTWHSPLNINFKKQLQLHRIVSTPVPLIFDNHLEFLHLQNNPWTNPNFKYVYIWTEYNENNIFYVNFQKTKEKTDNI